MTSPFISALCLICLLVCCINGYKPKQSLSNLKNLANNYKVAFEAEAGETGALVIPSQKLVICSIAKAGCTTIKWIALALLGYDRSKLCHTYVHNSTLFDHHGTSMVRKEIPPYFNMLPLSSTTDWKVSKYFRDPSWTTIAIVRDPWYRSISMYLDQLKRNFLPHKQQYDPHSKANFSTFITRHYKDMRHHTGQAYKFCGLDYVKYDHYIDIENLKDGFNEVFKHRGDLRPYLTEGWSNCTVNKAESLLDGQSDTHHQAKGFGDVAAKRSKYDSILCSNDTVDLVYDRFQEDYAIYSRWAPTLNYTKHQCAHN